MKEWVMENKLNIKEYLDKDEQKDLLRLLTAGSVDDGKSTLIGRLLFDSKKLYEDQLAALERDSKRVGNAGDHIDYALLCDGLKAEREQGKHEKTSATTTFYLLSLPFPLIVWEFLSHFVLASLPLGIDTSV